MLINVVQLLPAIGIPGLSFISSAKRYSHLTALVSLLWFPDRTWFRNVSLIE